MEKEAGYFEEGRTGEISGEKQSGVAGTKRVFRESRDRFCMPAKKGRKYVEETRAEKVARLKTCLRRCS